MYISSKIEEINETRIKFRDLVVDGNCRVGKIVIGPQLAKQHFKGEVPSEFDGLPLEVDEQCIGQMAKLVIEPWLAE